MFSRSSKGRLTDHDLGRFTSRSLFDRIAREVCHAGCLPRKELYEAWEVARRTRRLFRGGRVVDLGCGHALLAHVMLILDDSSPRALAVDAAIPASAAKLHERLVAAWPRLASRIDIVSADISTIDLDEDDVVVSCHACGRLTDVILERAASAHARVAVLPCCHDFASSDAGDLTGWLDPTLAIDVVRARRLAERGYRIWTQKISDEITPKNRLLLGMESPVGGSRSPVASRRSKRAVVRDSEAAQTGPSSGS